jgi:hypothetical protein
MRNADGRRSVRHPDEHELVQVVDASVGLRQLLAAASAPPTPAELKGRSRAIADFRAAQRPATHHQPVTPATGVLGPARRTPVSVVRASRWSAARLTVLCTALVVLLGGTAAAAAAGELPSALQNAVSGFLNAPTRSTPPPAPADPSAEPTAEPGASSAGSGHPTAPDGLPAARSHAAVGQPSAATATAPQLAGLCRAYQATGSAAAMLATPGLAPLVTAADGAPKVAAFCAQLTGRAEIGPPSAHPSSAHPSSAHPSSAHPTSAHPTSARSSVAHRPSTRPSAGSPSAGSSSSPADTARPDTPGAGAEASPAQPMGTARLAPGRAHPGSQPHAARQPAGPTVG